MRRTGYLAAFGVAVLAANIGCGNSSGEGPADGSADATSELAATQPEASADVVAETGDQQAPDGCAPSSVGNVQPFVPPNTRQSACTDTQIATLYQDCWVGSAAACNSFYGDPANSACIRCMLSDSTASTWGPIVKFTGEDITLPNTAGCFALVDGDAGPGGCGAATQALQLCGFMSCAGNCPNGSTAAGVAQLGTCTIQAFMTTCAQEYAKANPCGQAPQYGVCLFANFESQFRGLGQFFCAYVADAGADSAAGGDAGADASGASDAAADSEHD
jgi:hypothetical protein